MKLNVIMGGDALSPPLTGIGYYTVNLSRALQDSGEVSLSGVSVSGFYNESSLAVLLSKIDQDSVSVQEQVLAPSKQKLVSFVRSSPLAYRLVKSYRDYRVARFLSKINKNVIYHEPNFIPYSFSGRTVITVHDLSHIRYPETHPSTRVAYLNHELPKAIRKADVIIADSYFVKEELIDLGLVRDESRIVVTHLGCEEGFGGAELQCQKTEETLAEWGVSENGYILAVATLEPRKNLERLISAYVALPPAVAETFPLVLVGGAGWKNDALNQLVNKVRPPYRVVLTGYVPRDSVKILMSQASIFVYPSLYEGFGLPVLEAMSSGTAVVTSNTSSLLEISKGAAHLIDPYDIESISNGILHLLENEAVRASLALKGVARAKSFSWAKCAKQTIEVYQAIS